MPETGGSRSLHFTSIDVLRGLAAIAVVVFHYQHFYFVTWGASLRVEEYKIMPLYEALWPVYHYGELAVQIFWLISGFVFFHVYGHRQTSLREYVANRAARLMPLHLATLLLVAGLQELNLRMLGHWQIYGNNDLYHFLLQIPLASNWGFQEGSSFNAPIWSVSLEVLAYAAFAVVLIGVSIRYRRPACWAIAAISICLYLFNIKAGAAQCIACFFCGTIVYQINQFTGNRGSTVNIACSVAALALLTCGYAITVSWTGGDLGPMQAALVFLVFPASLWTLAALESGLKRLGVNRIRWIGDITYATYLTHVPLQLLLLFGLDYFIRGRELISSTGFFAIYVGSVIGLSVIIHRYFELPAQRLLRAGGRSRTGGVAGA